MNYFVNYYQSSQERGAKYHLARKAGLCRNEAYRYRDLTWAVIAQHLKMLGLATRTAVASTARQYHPRTYFDGRRHE